MILFYDSVQKEAREIVSLSHDLRWVSKTFPILDDLKFEGFTNLLEKNVPKFTAASFFEVERGTILNLLGTVITFLIVMIHFGNN
jgi:gustatory receptor